MQPAQPRAFTNNVTKEAIGPLRGATRVLTASLSDVPTADVLESWLQAQGVDTDTWGRDDTKTVAAFWKELKLEEAGLELWRKADGALQPLRVTHVLRAKVCSPQCYERGIFVFNTWQQFADGRRRTRNGLLSEKLSTAEIPLEGRLHEVCQRAIGEEMQRIVDSTFRVGPANPAPEYDPSGKCPLEVVQAKLMDHSIEIEPSKSFPGLLTLYHLYTVDIVCTGMPSFDFNTLEYAEPKDGRRPLKYVHAWVWLSWPEIRRYLFEGSKLAQKRIKGSFLDSEELGHWLSDFGIDLTSWGRAPLRSVEDLHKELERGETELELWSRHDGVPLLMRVVHLLQMKVRSATDEDKFLFQSWQQSATGAARLVHRFPARKLTATNLPTTSEDFRHVVCQAVDEELTCLVDAHFQLRPGQAAPLDTNKSQVAVLGCEFKDHRIDVEESPSYKGLATLYHIYTTEVECSGLPSTDFATLKVRDASRSDNGQKPSIAIANGWTWANWQECLDVMHARTTDLERRQSTLESAKVSQKASARNGMKTAEKLLDAVNRASASLGREDPDLQELLALLPQLQQSLQDLHQGIEDEEKAWKEDDGHVTKRVPPSMVTKMAEGTLPKEVRSQLEKLRRSCTDSMRLSQTLTQLPVHSEVHLRTLGDASPPR